MEDKISVSEIYEKILRLEQSVTAMQHQIDELKNANAKEVNTKEVILKEAKAEEIKAEEIKAEEAKAGEIKAEEAKAEEIKAEEAITTYNQAEAVAKDSESKETAAKTAKKEEIPVKAEAATIKSQVRQEKGKDLEHRIGQNFMGILASVMIFIALVLFVSLVYKTLTPLGQTVTLYAVSTVIVTAGFYFRRKLANTFAKSVIICGLGSFYITILATYFEFGLIKEIGLYVLIAIWMIATAILSKKIQSSSTAVIGQLGITISVLLGSLQKNEITLLYMLLFYYIGSSIFYQILFLKHKSQGVRLTIYIMGLIANASYAISIAANRIQVDRELTQYIPITLMLIASFYVWYIFFLKTFVHKKVSVNVVHILFMITSLPIMYALICNIVFSNVYYMQSISMLSAILIFWILIEIFGKADFGYYSNIVIFSIAAFICIYNIDAFYDVLKVAALWILLMGYGVLRENKFYQILGICFLTLQCILNGGEYYIANNLLFFFGVACVFGIMAFKRSIYSMGYKISIYIASMIGLIRMFDEIYDNAELYTSDNSEISVIVTTLFFVIIVIINTAAVMTKFSNDWSAALPKREAVTYYVGRSINGILWMYGMLKLYQTHMTLLPQILLIIAVCVVAMIGSKQPMETYKDKMFSGIYLGIKLTFTIWAICASFDMFSAIMTSILFLVIAIISILIGFKISAKSLRIYGLGLSMIAVIKLLQFDLQYGELMHRVLAFFIAGILCFVINFIYNLIEKKS